MFFYYIINHPEHKRISKDTCWYRALCKLFLSSFLLSLIILSCLSCPAPSSHIAHLLLSLVFPEQIAFRGILKNQGSQRLEEYQTMRPSNWLHRHAQRRAGWTHGLPHHVVRARECVLPCVRACSRACVRAPLRACVLPCVRAPLRACSLARLLPGLLAPWLACSLACLLPCLLAPLLACSLAPLLACSLACLLPCVLAPVLACSRACLLPCLLACSLACLLPCLDGRDRDRKTETDRPRPRPRPTDPVQIT